MILALVALLVLAPTTVVVFLLAVGVPAASAADCGPGGSAQKVEGTSLSAEQLANAATIVSTVKSLLPDTPYAATVALATAMQESSLTNNLQQVDHDSIGLFQQRVSIYGEATAADPVKSTTAFIKRLVKVPNWQVEPLSVAAQAVQVSANPNAYAQWQGLAEDLTSKLWPGAATTCSDSDGSISTGLTGIPKGFVPPSQAQQLAVIDFAMEQLGKPYQWGGSGPDKWDCSGLVQAAWAQAGVALPRTTAGQVSVGVDVPSLQVMEPGDLIFIPGSDGSISNPGHVGMYAGDANGVQYLIQAPHTGAVVDMEKVSDWVGEIAAIRRPVVSKQ
ncbi:C40 family peptidase [Rugosimonospora acidiphila]|uniref:C40 family peptidase n=1 Tax=Rugosimonospora acidiphila TaxID=556531 RepID=A0ABP9RWN8_9ACTN